LLKEFDVFINMKGLRRTTKREKKIDLKIYNLVVKVVQTRGNILIKKEKNAMVIGGTCIKR